MAVIIAIVIAIAIALILNKKFEDTISLSIFAIITILYISGLVSTFIPGLYAVYGVAILSLVFCIYKTAKNQSASKKVVSSYGFIAFIVLAIYFFLTSYGRYFGRIDDFIHWGIAAKYYYLYSDYSFMYSGDWAGRYPPLATLWAYFSTKAWMRCDTGMMLFGHQLFIVSLLMPVFNLSNTKKSKVGPIVLALLVLSLPNWIYSGKGEVSYTSLMPDLLIGALFFFILWTYREYKITKDKYYYFSSLYAAFVITLVKQTGIIHVLLVALAIFVINTKKEDVTLLGSIKEITPYLVTTAIAHFSWDIYKGMAEDGFNKSIFYIILKITPLKLAFAIVCLLAVVIMLLAWSRTRIMLERLYSKHKRYFQSAIFVLFLIFTVVLAFAKRYKLEGNAYSYYLKHFVEFFFDTESIYIGYLIKIPMAIFVVSIGILVRYVLKAHKSELLVWDVFLYCFVIYAIFRCLCRIIITPTEYPLASLPRYVYSGLVGVIIYCFCMLFEYMDIKGRDIILLASLVIFTNTSMMFYDLFDKPVGKHFSALDISYFNDEDRIFLVDTNIEDDRYELDFMYKAVPAIHSGSAFQADWYYEEDGVRERLTVQKVTKNILENGYTFIYIRNVDDGFADYYADLFEDVSDINNEHLYKVIKVSDDSVKLELCK
ncbi:hypothetical protein [Butyrivibrio proteoclasticus]|uniref:hypothetical protein n=1 Tax=Butyrivibrio proteoclasticus TaxID=43305 RepID=UPI00047A199C|nr:hypothetical protein [Butyrivibrio proteoclasticus]